MNHPTALEQRGFRCETDAADQLGSKPSTLRAWRVKGKGPRYYKIGGKVFYKDIDLETWIEAQARGSTSEVAA
ncbi:helix-turn-helix transcriptional regulator [Methylobacterium sp. 391_Methyba4]|uniref:helix-turn-helix transcriptional regulator n=1 Tax=Methylobacterium sp. 391_Methyba4 TaxID=3038924 RepID=UPI00241DDFD3|nr:helix-turn-helix domain-containing protein [Methylobacterium sp. 391_Methyba4]WFS07629.1 helix-turn-helix domain-containing protein [Methylobacterium sp. 391_Methyba4]